jgi:uncharacterized protein YbjT (DUF2867 family)
VTHAIVGATGNTGRRVAAMLLGRPPTSFADAMARDLFSSAVAVSGAHRAT